MSLTKSDFPGSEKDSIYLSKNVWNQAMIIDIEILTCPKLPKAIAMNILSKPFFLNEG